MLLLALAKDFLSILGFLYFGSCVWKSARGYPISRWFF